VKKRVLVVDDDSGTRAFLSEVLAEFDVEVYEAAHDEEAYQRYLEVGPDLLLIDVLLPRQGGLSLLRRIRGVRGGKDVPAFVMSAVYRGADLRAESMDELGAIDFLKKPFQLDLLRARLSEAIAERHDDAREAVTPFAPAEILNRGSLSNIDFPLLLKDLAFHKSTACLNLRYGSSKKILFFQDGDITFALSNQLRETLGRYLLSQGKIDEEAYRAGLEAMQRDGDKLGEFLLVEGYLEAPVLLDAVRENVFAKILEVFAWGGGDFRLAPYRDPPAGLPGQPFDVHHVLWEGVRRRFPYERLIASLNPYLEFALQPQHDLFDLTREVTLEGEELHFLRLLRRLRGQPLSRILSEVQSEQEVRFLYYLLLRGYLTIARGGVEGVEGRELDSSDLERVRRARRRADALRARNYFQVLELPLEATDEKVREAYLDKVKDVHPDMLGPEDPAELNHIHGETFHLIQTAYEGLNTEARRREYLKFIQEGLEEEVTDGSNILEAERLFQEGRIQLKRRDWNSATEAFRRAFELNPDEGEYALFLGIAKMRQVVAGSQEALPEAEDLLQRARKLIPASPEPYYHLGRLAVLRDDPERATSYFQTALARSPNHVEALREMRLLKMRTGKKAGGVLGAILGKREKS
jgi:CheY-like chemotaxis protein